jgi:hypothetical protein
LNNIIQSEHSVFSHLDKDDSNPSWNNLNSPKENIFIEKPFIKEENSKGKFAIHLVTKFLNL